jgi:surface antigen
MWDAYDAANKTTGHCPTHNADGVDHIFMSTSVNAPLRDYSITHPGNGSDVHNTLYADIVVSATDSAAGSSDSNPTPSKGYIGADGFGSGSCVDYVKYILARHSSKYSGGALGDGKDVARNLGKSPYGYTVDNKPAVHATVSFPTTLADPVSGHVALVAEIFPDGSIMVEESNWNVTLHYGTHKVSADEVPKLTYAHTEQGWH